MKKVLKFKASEYKWKKALALVLCFAVIWAALLFVGCDDSAADPGDQGEIGGETVSYDVELYFVNRTYVEEGDETLGRFQPAVETTVTSTPGGVYLETLKALSQEPEQEGYATMLKDSIRVDGAILEEDGKTLTVDFMSQGLSGGSTEESLLVEQIVMTMIRSFDEVEQVRFTVDGAPAETLMGHMDASVSYGIQWVDDGEGNEVETVMPLYE